MTRKNKQVPEPIAEAQRQLEQFRSTHPPRTKLPESIWQLAVELARQYGVYPVAHPLRLDYMGLQRRLGRRSGRRQGETSAAFVELVAPPVAKLDECVIEFESSRGAKMRIQWRAAGPPDWANLLRAWREADR